jgi:hypothetical protein
MSLQTLTATKQVIKIGNQPMVIMPLTKWQEIEDKLEDLEDLKRFNNAMKNKDNQECISFDEVKKKYNLK